MEYIISDLHFYHQNIIGFDKRPFDTVGEMNEVLINNWNSVVTAEDTVYVLGDMFYKCSRSQAESVLQRLKGRIIYLYGNHERLLTANTPLLPKPIAKERFSEVHNYLEIKYKYKEFMNVLVMSHYPIPMYNGHFKPSTVHFYGHVHRTEEQVYTIYQQLMNLMNSNQKHTHKMINVGVMMSYMDYRPQPISYVIDKAEERSNMLFDYFNDECKGVMPTLEEFKKQTHLYL